MNKIEGQSSGFKDTKNNFSKRVGAVVLAAGLVVAGVGVGGEAESEIRIDGDMPSQKPDFLPGGNGGSGSEAGVEVFPIEITDEYKQEVVNQIMDFKGPEIAPIPTEKIRNIFKNWEEETFGPFRKELKELGADNENRIKYGARALYAHKNSGKLGAYGANEDKFQNYVTYQDIIDFVITGENDDVISDEDGNMVWIVSADKKAEKKIKQGFQDAISLFAKNGIHDVLESSSNNGFCILFCSKTQPENNAGATFLNEYGVIWQNFDSTNINGVKINNIETKILLVEPYGIIYLQYCMALKYSWDFGNSFGLTEVVKDTIGSLVALSLNDKAGLYRIFGESFKLSAESFAKELSISEIAGKRQIGFMADFIDPVGYEDLREVEGFSDLIDLTKK